MAKRKARDPNSLRAGDFLRLVVPANRHLQPGTYCARIESVKYRWYRHTLHCVLPLDGDLDDPDAVLIHFQLTIYDRAARRGQCYLGPDTFPVEYTHEQNLERRLAESLPPKTRLPYADT